MVSDFHPDLRCLAGSRRKYRILQIEQYIHFVFPILIFHRQKSDESRFASFKKTFNKIYEESKEEERRFRIFRANLKKIQSLNEAELGTAVYGVTEFADLSSKSNTDPISEFLKSHSEIVMRVMRSLFFFSEYEFRKHFLGLDIPHRSRFERISADQVPKFDHIDLPVNYDWRAFNAVTPVKNQVGLPSSPPS